MRALILSAALALAGAPSVAAADPWTQLHRPLRIPHIAVGSRCPLSDVSHPSPGRGISLGRGPAYPVGLGRGRTLFFAYPVPPSQLWFPSDWSGNKVLWIVAPRYRGPLLIRGRQLDGPNLVRFDRGSLPPVELRLPASGVEFADGFRDRPSFTRLRAAGCYAWQIDGTTFSRVVVFRAVTSG
jgi:hypothetical protein